MKPWINGLALCAQIALGVATGVVVTVLCSAWLGNSSESTGVAFLLVWPLLLLALVAHELGHLVCARLVGMTVWAINIAGLEFYAQRRGWKVRWSRIRRRQIGGFVLAFPQFGQPMRRQMIGLSLGGPAGNIAIAVLLGVIGWALLPRAVGFLSLALCSVNAGFALINLVPHQGTMPTDGLRLITWLSGVDEASPHLAFTRLMSRSLAGQTADQLPENELTTLEQQALPMPLVALWYRLKADQNRNNWARAVSRSTQFDVLAETLGPSGRAMLTELLATLRTELAFSKAMLTGDRTELADDLLPADAAWTAPWLLPRCQALSASLQGDQARCVQLLEVSKRSAEKAIDPALWQSEALLRRYIEAIAGDR